MKLIRNMRPRRAVMMLAIAFLPAVMPPLLGQAIYGSLYGQVTDQSGAAVPNATITITDVSKGTSVQTTSTASGEYLVEHLIPDSYNVRVVAAGFRAQENQGLQISADTSPKVDFKLDVGTASETVNVTAALPVLKTDRADVAKVFDQRTVSDLPIAGRNFANLELLIPGAQVMAWSQNSAENPQGSPTVQINGQHFSGVSYELDGAPPTRTRFWVKSSSIPRLME